MSFPNSNVESFPRDSPGTNGEMIKQENETDVHLKMEGEEASGVSACELGRNSYKSEDGEQILGLPSELRMNDGHNLFESLPLVQSSSDISSFATAIIPSEVVNPPCRRIPVGVSPLMNDEKRDIKPASSYPIFSSGELEDDSFTSEIILKTEPIMQDDSFLEGIKKESEETKIFGGEMENEQLDKNCVENPGAVQTDTREQPIEGGSPMPMTWSEGFCTDKTTNGRISTSEAPRTRRHSRGHTEARSNRTSIFQNTVLKSHGVWRTRKRRNDKCDLASGDLDNCNTPKRIRTDDDSFNCALCPYVSNRKPNLKSHMRIHTGEKPYKCSECDFATRYTKSMSLHKRRHTGEKPYKCSECDFTARYSKNLTLHRLIHTGEKPFTCSECDFATGNKTHLKRHMLTHTLEKPFKCSECDFATRRQENLKGHMFTHTDEKRFWCSECDFATGLSWVLKRHKLIHLDEKPTK